MTILIENKNDLKENLIIELLEASNLNEALEQALSI